MANFDINNFIIDRAIRGTMVSHKTGEIMYSINQVEDPQLTVSADEKTAVDAMGTTIATFNTAKNAEFSGSNSLFDLSLLATQMGTSKKVADSLNKIVTPIFETIDVTGKTVTIKHEPVGKKLDVIYALNGDSTLGKKYTADTQESATKFKYENTTKTITLPTEVTSGQVFVMYEAEVENAVEVEASATEFPTGGKFILEVLGCDVCDQTTLRYAYIIFPNAKLDSNVDISFTTDGKHPFSMKANQSYCDSKKTLFKIVIPELQ